MKKFCCVLLALLPLSALAFSTDVSKKIEGVQVDYSASDIAGDISSIQLNNYGTNDAQCTVVFTNGPESPRTRRVTVPAGKSTHTTVKFNRAIIKMRIALTCAPK
ncbi:3-phosphoglycerate kinase [Pseudomonas sp. SDO528_S397]